MNRENLRKMILINTKDETEVYFHGFTSFSDPIFEHGICLGVGQSPAVIYETEDGRINYTDLSEVKFI